MLHHRYRARATRVRQTSSNSDSNYWPQRRDGHHLPMEIILMLAVNGGLTLDEDVVKQIASQLADAAREVTLALFDQSLAHHRKADNSPVTQADRDAEQAMRSILAERVPAHGILGEEFGDVRTDAEYVWVLDPIDGTKAFITGRPLWGTLIGLMHRGEPYFGLLDLSPLDQRLAGFSQHAQINGEPCRTSDCRQLADARLGCTSPDMFKPGAELDAFLRVRDAAWFCSYGGDCSAYAAVARGALDVVVEADLQPYDYLPLVPVIEGAGGKITDWNGRALSLGCGVAQVVATANPELHTAALALLATQRA